MPYPLKNKPKEDTVPLLEVKNLRIRFPGNPCPAVDGISFSLEQGARLAIAGESGSGKSSAALALLRLLDDKALAEGEILYRGRNLLTFSEPEMEAIRGKEISMIFQEPMTALNPVFTAGRQIEEALRVHEGLSASQARRRTQEMLELAGFPEPRRTAAQYPHQLSGGMRQRVMIAMALACRPKILIADEPTTALDVTIQAQILTLIKKLQEELGTALILITHDLGVVAETCETLLVMYAGKIVERVHTAELLSKGAVHPYTAALLDSAENLTPIEAARPLPSYALPANLCSFAPRCPYARERCFTGQPQGPCPCFYPLREVH